MNYSEKQLFRQQMNVFLLAIRDIYFSELFHDFF